MRRWVESMVPYAKLVLTGVQVYLLLWFWMFGLTLLTAIHLLLRFAVIAIHPLR
jgi:hypothetical protein